MKLFGILLLVVSVSAQYPRAFPSGLTPSFSSNFAPRTTTSNFLYSTPAQGLRLTTPSFPSNFAPRTTTSNFLYGTTIPQAARVSSFPAAQNYPRVSAFPGVSNMFAASSFGAPVAATGPARGGDCAPKVAATCSRKINKVQPRLEIKTLAADPKYVAQYHLFMLAFRAMMDKPPSDLQSYFQLATIHAAPYVAYNNSFNESMGEYFIEHDPGTPEWRLGGYAHHHDILFHPWHRMYMAHFETQLRSIAKEIANEYPAATRDTYVCAAEELRLPYWDWADDHAAEIGAPDVLTSEKVTVVAPAGVKSITNPLWRYQTPRALKFGRGIKPGMDQFEMKAGEWTKRWPNYPDEGVENNNKAFKEEGKKISAKCIQPLTFRMLQRTKTFRCFSYNDQLGLNGNEPCPDDQPSWELVHDIGHRIVGGGTFVGAPEGSKYFGQASDTPHQSIEPTFFLHHTQLDRLAAMWDVINPDSPIIGEMDTGYGSFTRPQQSFLTENAELTPFFAGSSESWNAKGKYYTPKDIRKLDDAIYTYPELIDNPSKEELMKRVHKLYNSKEQWGENGDKSIGVCDFCTGPGGFYKMKC